MSDQFLWEAIDCDVISITLSESDGAVTAPFVSIEQVWKLHNYITRSVAHGDVAVCAWFSFPLATISNTIAKIRPREKIDNTLQENLNETLKECRAWTNHSGRYGPIYTLSSYSHDYLPVTIRCTSSIQRHQPMTVVSLKVTHRLSIKEDVSLSSPGHLSTSLNRTSGDRCPAVPITTITPRQQQRVRGWSLNRVAL